MPDHDTLTPPDTISSLEDARARRAARAQSTVSDDSHGPDDGSRSGVSMAGLLGLLGMDPAHVHAFEHTGHLARAASEISDEADARSWQRAVDQWRSPQPEPTGGAGYARPAFRRLTYAVPLAAEAAAGTVSFEPRATPSAPTTKGRSDMPANATRAQRAQEYSDRGIMDPNSAMTPDELQRHLGRRSVTFNHRNTKRLRTRGAQRSRAINDQR